jgi:hypothetical protein
MLLTFFLFLAFVVNTGMLVNAKINLQNAADLAAYAGAAVQARQLNDIGALNYEMRRAYKKFLFRYYVVGNVTQPSFPKNGSTGGAARFAVNELGNLQGAPTLVDLGVPSTCVTFLPNDNYCAIRGLPAISRPAGGNINSLDAIMAALDNKLTEIEKIRKKGCVGIGKMNQMLMLFWLWNTDPNLEAIADAINQGVSPNDPDAQQYVLRLQVLRSLASGIGLIPREIFLRKRIDTLNRYVNFAPQNAVNLQKANALKGGQDWAMHERTIQAFLSAYHTLGNNTFQGSEVEMDEILPSGAGEANLLKLKDLTAEFDAFATDFSIAAPGVAPCTPSDVESGKVDERDGGCVQCLVSFPQSQKFSGFRPILGVAKDPAVLTYYAVRMRAKARLLFSPYGDLTLTAYAAAQPFGSRIGPPESEARFTAPGAPGTGAYSRCNNGTLCVGAIPNLPVKETDSASPSLGSGWAQGDVLYHMYAAGLRGGSSVSQSVTQIDLLRAYHVAMAPNPWEQGRYLIPNDVNDDPFLRSFDDKGVRAIWAPLFTGSSTAANANPANEIIGFLDKLSKEYVTQSASANETLNPATQSALKSQINAYVNGFLKKGEGEDGEGLNVIRIYDPLTTRQNIDGNRTPIAPSIPDTILMRDAKRLKTGWNNVLADDQDHRYRTLGRTGYSVKFVPVNMLRSASGITTDGRNSFTNTLQGAGVANETAEMKH